LIFLLVHSFCLSSSLLFGTFLLDVEFLWYDRAGVGFTERTLKNLIQSTTMPAGPDETDNHQAGSITEHVAQNASSKTESTASDHPIHGNDKPAGDKVEFRHHEANPGPVIPKEFNIQQEGTKEERRAKAEAMNK